MNKYEHIVDKNKLNEIFNLTINVINFKSARDLKNINIVTDQDEYGGDTEAFLSYNIEEDALIVSGQFEMKNRHLIEHDRMFAKIYFKNLKEYYYDKINIVRLRIKTNGHAINLTLEEKILNIETNFWKAHILDHSNEFNTYEIPLKNFKLANEYTLPGKHIMDNINLRDLVIEIESKKEGPFEFELKSIDFAYNHLAEKYYSNYNKPIFLKI